MYKDLVTSKYMMVDKVGTSNFSNKVWEGNGFFQIKENYHTSIKKKKRGPVPFTGHKTRHISEKLVKKGCINSHSFIKLKSLSTFLCYKSFKFHGCEIQREMFVTPCISLNGSCSEFPHKVL